MGNELAQFREWDEKREQDWDILKFPKHDEFHHFMQELNQLYLDNPAFWEKDYDREGFVWLDCHQEQKCIYAFERRSEKQRILAIFNFSNMLQTEYELQISGAKQLKLLFTADDLEMQALYPEYGEDIEIRDGKAVFELPPYAARYYEVLENDKTTSENDKTILDNVKNQ
jgi:1,4-alpha-glucan branching enzyme